MPNSTPPPSCAKPNVSRHCHLPPREKTKDIVGAGSGLATLSPPISKDLPVSKQRAASAGQGSQRKGLRTDGCPHGLNQRGNSRKTPPSDGAGQALHPVSPGSDFSADGLFQLLLACSGRGWQRPRSTRLSFQSFCFSLHKLPCPYLIRGCFLCLFPAIRAAGAILSSNRMKIER